MRIHISFQQETRKTCQTCKNDVVKSLKHYSNVCVLGIFVFYFTTPLYCCDYVRAISLHRLNVFLIRGHQVQYSGQNRKYKQWVFEKVHADCYYKNLWYRPELKTLL